VKEKIIYNGKLLDAETAIVSSKSRGLRYGDGCFETMKMKDGRIILYELHFERLFSSLELLGFELPMHFSSDNFKNEVEELAGKNRHKKHGRIRLTFFRGDGGLYGAENNLPNYVIETWKLEDEVGLFNENGLVTGIFKDARKAADNFSHIKANSFMPYILAANWAKKNRLNDALLLNSYDKIADATIANVFIVKDGVIKTPALTEGCIGGVMRRFLINCCKKEGLPIEETSLSVDDVAEASEIFLTNAIRRIQWVKQVGKDNYSFSVSKLLYDKFVKTLL
jgi:branched-subunit amino acid aminotransferase/4-amino-4-deoxychorismate lyase